MLSPRTEPGTQVTRAPNGVRTLTIAMPGRETVAVSVFVRTGSQHESRRQSGISHVVEHMAFKGTATRDCQRINLEAERLGAEVNAHTDKDHTAYHIVGLKRDLGDFVRLLGDIVQHGTYPAAELERERQVILHELAEDDEDSLSTAFKLFDRACWGEHALARPVIGHRANIERFTRDELLAYVERQYTGGNVIVGVAGDIDPEAVRREVEAAFADLPPGADNLVEPPVYRGGFLQRSLAGSVQTHAVLGFPIPGLREDAAAETVAAALFGEGMSSPLLDQLRERRGLAYHAACSADRGELAGQFVVEASTAPEQVEELFEQVVRLLAEQAEAIDPVGLERARNQLTVRKLRALERPVQRLETAALDLYAHGQVRSSAQWLERIAEVGADEVRAACRRLLACRPAIALAGRVTRRAAQRVPGIVERLRRSGPT
ncbi:MAG: insulinase family protein [Burkholderiales bacterium]|nr:insulinase family protein [Burkholderiales bacterium]MDE1927414.1 insulinase family protein [Burkholderiales bacterium]MDE2504849.1 insulinase family protein [Burkholderiales bacterium]